MTPRPTRSIEPLPPPPGRFDQVLREARSRRYRRAAAVTGVTGVFLAGIMGGLALGGVGGVQQRIVALAGGNTHTAEPSDTATATKAASRTVGTTATTSTHKSHPSRHSGTSGPAQPVAMVRGRAVDMSGTPVVGAYVYGGHYQAGDFLPTALPVARTGPTGRFAIPCGGAVLITPWPLNRPLREAVTSPVAATMVTAPVCSGSTDAQVTTMPAGSTVEGQVRTDVGCASEDFQAALWLDGNRSTAIRLAHLHEGDAFRLTGVPQGKHLLRIHGKEYDVAVPAGAATVTRNVTVACPDLPTPTEIPSLTPSPAPTPSETQSPSPTTTATPTESPSPTGTAQRQ